MVRFDAKPAGLNDVPLDGLYERLHATGLVTRLLELARDEDLGPAAFDVTSAVAVVPGETGEASIVAREPGRIAGIACAPELVELFAGSLAPAGPDGAVAFEPRCGDGDRVEAGAVVARLRGPLASILGAERTLLNLLGRLSGIATRTAAFVDALGPEHAGRLYDTRKTTPGLRVLEKYAVRCGGGRCHRLGLYDAVLIKDNHVAAVAPDDLTRWVTEASQRAFRHGLESGEPPAFVEVEVDTLDQLERVLAVETGLVDVVLLDNMTTDALRRAVAIRERLNPGVALEASGGVTIDSVRAIAETGVDRVSCGSLTHHAVGLDLGLDLGPDLGLDSGPDAPRRVEGGPGA